MIHSASEEEEEEGFKSDAEPQAGLTLETLADILNYPSSPQLYDHYSSMVRALKGQTFVNQVLTPYKMMLHEMNMRRTQLPITMFRHRRQKTLAPSTPIRSQCLHLPNPTT